MLEERFVPVINSPKGQRTLAPRSTRELALEVLEEQLKLERKGTMGFISSGHFTYVDKSDA